MKLSLESLFSPALLGKILSLSERGKTIYLVGGAVRDLLQGTPIHDLDFVMEGDVLQIARKVADRLGGSFYILDAERDYGRVIYRNEENGIRMVMDFAPLVSGGLEFDLRRRDFTINAMALPLVKEPEVIDILDGVKDLQDRLLRACSENAFLDDPVRILRGVRLSVGRDYLLEPQTIRWMKIAVPDLSDTSGERLRDELIRILEGLHTSKALVLLDEIDALKIVLPELTAMKGVHQSPPHVLDVWEHTLAAIDALEMVLASLTGEKNTEEGDNFKIRILIEKLGKYQENICGYLAEEKVSGRSLRGLLFLEMLYHDSGKPECRKVEANGRVRFLGHEENSSHRLSSRAHKLAFSQAEIQHMTLVINRHMRVHLLTQAGDGPSSRSIYRFFRHHGEAGVAVCLLSLADTLATYGPTLTAEYWTSEVEVCRLLLEAWWDKPTEVVSPPRLINGTDLMEIFRIQPGPLIGVLLAAIQEAQACGEVKDREEAISLAAQILENNRISP